MLFWSCFISCSSLRNTVLHLWNTLPFPSPAQPIRLGQRVAIAPAARQTLALEHAFLVHGFQVAADRRRDVASVGQPPPESHARGRRVPARASAGRRASKGRAIIENK